MYDNGMTTRNLILASCRKLFYTKGYQETSFEDISREAHVNRRSIYYHFKDKELLRYEVTWDTFIRNRNLAKQYCQEEKLQELLALYMLWHQCMNLPGVGRFHAVYSRDCPVYDLHSGLPMFYRTVYAHIFGDQWAMDSISPLAYATVYGHLIGMMQLVAEHPENYCAKDVFMHGITTCATIWGMPEKAVAPLWEKLCVYMDQIPVEEIEGVIL